MLQSHFKKRNQIPILFFAITVLVSCENAKKQNVIIDPNCDKTKLVNYIHPIDNYLKEKSLVYSLQSNADSNVEYFKKEFKLKIDKDSLLFNISKDSLGVITDSTIFSVTNGIPLLQKSYTRVPDLFPFMIPVKIVTVGNKFCEYTTYSDSNSYKIPMENGEMTRNFKGYTTHKKYVKEVFNGIQYNCAIIESSKTLTVSFKGREDMVEGTWTGCVCENLGELYSKTVLENGRVINQQLEQVIE
ncbi:MAG: hypothetical protein K0U54_10140 [Bacteroidetes bacterium]|nr:hypothetical protein [Bacteroidota bacterium]